MRAGTGEVEADFAGELRPFRLRLGELRRIEDRCDCGIGEVARRLARALTVLSNLTGVQALHAGVEVRSDDVRETILQGLAGAGMPSTDAAKLVRREIDERGLPGILDNVSVAITVLVGSQEAPDPGELQAGTADAATPPNEPTSAPSSASAQPSAGPSET